MKQINTVQRAHLSPDVQSGLCSASHRYVLEDMFDACVKNKGFSKAVHCSGCFGWMISCSHAGKVTAEMTHTGNYSLKLMTPISTKHKIP